MIVDSSAGIVDLNKMLFLLEREKIIRGLAASQFYIKLNV